MTGESRPSGNLLAAGGAASDEQGRIVRPPWGELELDWLVQASPERVRLAKEHLSKEPELEEETRLSWFIVRGGPDWEALKLLQDKQWRRSLKNWAGKKWVDLHNKATLHRLLFSEGGDSERPQAHLREALRLYHRLSRVQPEQVLYAKLQESLTKELYQVTRADYVADRDEELPQNFEVLRGLEGTRKLGRFMEVLLGDDFDRLKVHWASVNQELLPYQGHVDAPPAERLKELARSVEQDFLPAAGRLCRLLPEGSAKRQELAEQAAQLSALLGQSFGKARDRQNQQHWLDEARNWEPEAVREWTQVEPDELEEEEAAAVVFPEKEVEEEVTPSPWGSRLFGVCCVNTDWSKEQAREEWVESFYLLGLKIFPLRRFAAYRNMDTGEIGYYTKIPLLVRDHLRQSLSVVLLTFFCLVAGLRVAPIVYQPETPAELSAQEKKTRSEIAKAVERLKILAEKESDLKEGGQATEARLKALRAERQALIDKIQKLERK